MSSSETRKKVITKALAHEFYRCMDAFLAFSYHSANPTGIASKRNKLLCYQSYSDFLAHLYEFYFKLIDQSLASKTNNNPTNYPDDIAGDHRKKVHFTLNHEVRKLLRNRKNRLEHEYPDNLHLDISFYDEPVPEDFAYHLSLMRHWRNHVNAKRIANDQLSLAKFYKLYHPYVVILFRENVWYWQVDEETYDWQDLESFIDEIKYS